MSALFTYLLRMLVLAAVTLSLVATGFAHRAPDADERLAAAMVAAGASVQDICGGPGPVGGHSDPLCQACQIAGGADLPLRITLAQPAALVWLARVFAPRENKSVARVLDMSRIPQAPPVS